MAESFYGGRKGPSYNIVKSYSTKAEMVEDFGNPECEVQIDECVLINGSSNASEHGNIYKRGYQLSNDDNGAIWLGNIAGPAGVGLTPDFYYYDDTLTSNEEILNTLTTTFSPNESKYQNKIVAYGKNSLVNTVFYGCYPSLDGGNNYEWRYLGKIVNSITIMDKDSYTPEYLQRFPLTSNSMLLLLEDV